MGNKRGRAPRGKRANNWNAIQNLKKKMLIGNSNTSELAGQKINQSVDEDVNPDLNRIAIYDIELSECRTIKSEESDEESGSASIKRIRIYDSKELSSYYALLSEDKDAVVSEDNDSVVSEHNDDKNLNAENDSTNTQAVDPPNTDSEDVNEEENNNETERNDDEVDRERNYLSSSDDDDEEIEECKLTGRRLFDISDHFEKLKEIGRHSRNCSYEDMTCFSETKKGMNSIFKFRCGNCGAIRKLESCLKKPLTLTLNEEAVLGINSIGSGFYHLQEFSSHIQVPCMGNSTYDTISKDQQSDWFSLAKQKALEALREEVGLTRANNELDDKGNVLIAVISDGGWGKRSYGKKFNSLSGCAVLIGKRTNFFVFFGVRNKYCHVCKIAESKGIEVREHDCNINYSGPSSGMEADIVLEGFRSSEESGARFYKLIADGDSSVYKTLRDLRVYKNPDLVILKVECVNHLCRNFRSKFKCLAKIIKFNSKLRKHITDSKANGICKGVKTAAKHWREAINVSPSQKIRNLQDDIMNAPLHYFGVHTHCKTYFCGKETEQRAIDNLRLCKTDGLFYEVLNLCQIYFAGNATSLLENETNNPAEEFNNVVAKYLGGKRVNYSLAKSYSARVAMAVVQCNTGGHAATAIRKFKLGNDQEFSTEKLEHYRRRKLEANAVALQTKARDRHSIEAPKTGDYFHGEGFGDVDKNLENFERCKEIFLKKLEDRQKNWKTIERETIDKSYSAYWHEMRQDMLPSPHFHKISNAQKRDTYTGILQELMYTRSEFGSNAQIKHQNLHERQALSSFIDEFNEKLEECGLFICKDKDLPFLCASPFRLYGNNHILHIKCPLKEFGKKFIDVAPKMQFFKTVSGHLTINEKSPWFIEMQGEMHVTGREYVYLMIWLGEHEYRIMEVAKNDNFFEEIMKPKLTFFFMEAMLKELVDSRIGRRMKLRTYNAEHSTFL